MLVPCVLAQNPNVELLSSKENTFPGGSATYTFIVTSNEAHDTTYLITANPLDVYPFSDTIKSIKAEPSTLLLTPGSSEEVTITLQTFDDATPKKRYQTNIYVRSAADQNVKTQVPITVNIVQPKQLVKFSTTFPDDVVAAKGQKFDITYEATANTLLLNTTITVSSPAFSESFTVPIHYKDPQTKTLSFDIPKETANGAYELTISAEHDGNIVGTYIKTFNIVSNPNIKEDITRDNSILTRGVVITKKNIGNLELEDSIVVNLNRFQQIFTLTDPEPTSVEGNVYTWKLDIKPGESQSVKIFIDYRALVLSVVLFVCFVIFFLYLMTRKIIVKKSIIHTKTDDEGLSEVKVRITVINKIKSFDNVTLIDTVPNLMKPTGEFGTLKPRAIKKGNDGTKIVWEFSHFERGEERIITYTANSKMHIVGALRLAPAHVIVRRGNRTQTYKSNSFIFSTRKKEKKPAAE